MLPRKSFIQTEQIYSIDHDPSMTLNHIFVSSTLIIDENDHNQTRCILKKRLPPNVQFQHLYVPKNVVIKQQQLQLSTNANVHMKILNSLVPVKFQNNEIYSSGLMFIGLGIHQTIDIEVHVYNHLIPTIENENLDLQDPYISKQNREFLSFIDLINSNSYSYDNAKIC